MNIVLINIRALDLMLEIINHIFIVRFYVGLILFCDFLKYMELSFEFFILKSKIFDLLLVLKLLVTIMLMNAH
jgi:hypothetical protein